MFALLLMRRLLSHNENMSRPPLPRVSFSIFSPLAATELFQDVSLPSCRGWGGEVVVGVVVFHAMLSIRVRRGLPPLPMGEWQPCSLSHFLSCPKVNCVVRESEPCDLAGKRGSPVPLGCRGELHPLFLFIVVSSERLGCRKTNNPRLQAAAA